MEEKGLSQDILGEIFDKAESVPSPQRPRFEYPPQDESPGPPPVKDSPSPAPPPNGPTEKSRPSDGGTRLLPYVCMIMGTALLAMAVCLFLMVGMNGRLDALEEAVAGLDSVDQQLAEENDRLEEENAALQKDINLYQCSTTQAREQYKNERLANAEYQEQLHQTRSQLANTIILGYLERFINEGDYLMAACVVEECDQYFNENNWVQLEIDALPTQVTRYMELRDWLFDNTYIAMYEYPSDNGSAAERTERPVIAASTTNVSDETRAICVAARNLWGIIWYYSESRSTDYFYDTAIQTAIFCHPERGNSEQLYSKAFQPSTIALFEQIKADLMDQGLLVEQDDLLYFADDGGPVDFDVLMAGA